MAITKTTTLQRIEVQPGSTNGPPGDPPPADPTPSMNCILQETFDSSTDDLLPVTATGVYHFEKGDDVSDMPALAQTVAAAIWAD